MGDGTPIVCRRRDGALAGGCKEITAPDFDADATGHELLASQALARQPCESRQFGLQDARIADVSLEGVFRAERLLVAIRNNRTVVDPRSAFPHALGVSPEQRPQ